MHERKRARSSRSPGLPGRLTSAGPAKWIPPIPVIGAIYWKILRMRHVAYSAGWKKFEVVRDALIRAHQVAHALPVLEGVLTGVGRLHRRPLMGNQESSVDPFPAIGGTGTAACR